MRRNQTKRLLAGGRLVIGTFCAGAGASRSIARAAANRRLAQDFRLINVMSDFRLVRATAAETLRAITRA